MKLSVVMPAYNEERNLPQVIDRIIDVVNTGVIGRSGPARASGTDPGSQAGQVITELEILVVDDHSSDGTIDVVSQASIKHPCVRGIRLARNCGSHMAIFAGVACVSGDVCVVMASDGQDPPETIPALLDGWREGFQVVWAVRERREGEQRSTLFFSRMFYAVMNRVSSVRMPPTGADFVLFDRAVADALLRFPERNFHFMMLLYWLGFRQKEILYVKQARLSGTSNYTFAKKIRLMLDSLVGFSVMPLRIASVVGAVFTLLGLGYAALLVMNEITDGAVLGTFSGGLGWPVLMSVVLVTSGMILLVLGTLGEYLWRVLEEVRNRPRFPIEKRVGEFPDTSNTRDERTGAKRES